MRISELSREDALPCWGAGLSPMGSGGGESVGGIGSVDSPGRSLMFASGRRSGLSPAWEGGRQLSVNLTGPEDWACEA